MAIELHNVTKKFGPVRALDRVSVRFEKNHIYGLLGRNGAGKSTLLSLINGRQAPTEGTVTLDGEPVWENDAVLRKIASMSEVNYYPERLKVCEIFSLLEKIYPDFQMDYAVKLSKKFELDTLKRNDRLSTGYTSIMKLIAVMASETPYMLLDEPVLGLDANNRELFYRELIENFAEHPKTVIFSTHLIEEAEKLIDHAVLIKAGRVLRDDSVEHLTAGCYSVSGPAGAVDRYTEGRDILGSNVLGGLKTVYLRGKPDKAALFNGLEIGTMSLQKLFIELTNREGVDFS